MALVIFLGILASILDSRALASNFGSGYKVCVNASDSSDDLAFVNPKPFQNMFYPTRSTFSMENRFQIISCCGTGFSTVRWYFNDKFISASDEQFDIVEDGQALYWKSTSPVGRNNITCELVKNDSNTLRHNIMAVVVDDCVEMRPYFTILPTNQCASPGDNVTFQCEVQFDDDKCIPEFFKIVQFFDMNEVYISPTKEGYENVMIDYQRSSGSDSYIRLGTLTFTGITESQLNTSYYCVPRRHEYLKADFAFSGPCIKPTIKKDIHVVHKYFDQNLATQISIPILVALFVVIVVGALLYVYRREIGILWNTHIKPSKKGMNAYDAYLICSADKADQQFMVDHVMPQLEQYYKLCVPDRDFLLGSVIPEQMTEYVTSSKRVIVITSASMLQTDYCDLSLIVGMANKIPLIFVKPPPRDAPDSGVSLEELLSERPEVSAAIAVSNVLSFPKEVTDRSLCTFYNSLYSAMPFASNRTEQPTEVKLA